MTDVKPDSSALIQGRRHYQLIPAKGLDESSQRPTTDDPSLILLCTWADALPRQIEKFVNGYQELYPNTPILLTRTWMSDFFTFAPPLETKARFPCRTIQNDCVDVSGRAASSGGLLAHAMSNGGSSHLLSIAKRYYADTGNKLPIKALVFDSTPVVPTFKALLAVLTMPFARYVWIRRPLKVLFALALVVFHVIPERLGITRLRESLYNDLYVTSDSEDKRKRELIVKKALRTYIYSDTDQLCPGPQIAAHAVEAARRGFRVRQERWEGSGHVAHMKQDPERYWKVVKETWDQR